MSDTRGNEQDPLPASSGRRAKGTGPTRGGRAKSADAVDADTGNAATARGREPGRPAARAHVAGRGGRTAARRIGIRELRQRASVFVDLAEKGYTVDITNRGRLVAQLVPVNEPGSALERLIAAGIIEPAEEPGGAEGLEPYPPSGPGEPA
jgi:antitoxin (DNA-binding transcriptional repressor) of toxin-antitoxin stability system